MYHNISRSVTNVPRPRYAQLYFLDSLQSAAERSNLDQIHTTDNLNADILRKIDEYIRQYNPFADAYQMMKDVVSYLQTHQPQEKVQIYFNQTLNRNVAVHAAQLNQLRTINGIAAIYHTSDDNDAPPLRDIVVRNCANGGWINIPEISKL